MTRKHFSATTFLQRLVELEARPKTPARMHSDGRQRSNNSLAGIEFSSNQVPNASPRRSFSCERRHRSPAWRTRTDLGDSGTIDCAVRKHSIRIVSTPHRLDHFDGMIAVPPAATSDSVAVRPTSRPTRSASEPRRKSMAVDAEIRTNGATYRPTKRTFVEESRTCALGDALVPREETPVPRPTPEPMVLKPRRRVRQFAQDPALSREGHECNHPDYGHRAMVGAPHHYEPAIPRKGSAPNPTVTQDNIAVGSFVPLTEPVYHPLTSQHGAIGREYDVISLLPCPSRSSSCNVSPRRVGLAGTPLRHCDRKNRSSSPNILAWDA